MNIRPLLFLVLLLVSLSSYPSFRHPSFSPDGKLMLLTGEDMSGVYLYDFPRETLVKVADGKSSGRWYNWAPDGKRFGFKALIEQKDGRFLQVPSVYDIGSGTVIPLTSPVPRAGVPSFSKDGRVAFTLGEDVMVLDGSYGLEAVLELGVYANLAPISPDGRTIVFNDGDDQLWMLDLGTAKRSRVTGGERGFFGPVWSPDGKRILCSTLDGELFVIDTGTMELAPLGRGAGYSWSPDGQNIIFSRYYGEAGMNITGSDIFMTSADGRTTRKLSDQPSGFSVEPSLSASGELVFYSEKAGKLYGTGPQRKARSELAIDGRCAEMAAASTAGPAVPDALYLPPQPEADVAISGVPYLHQVYDTPNWFNGNWACNATAAMMCIAYYKILPYWDCTVSVPWSHTSHYGRYECETYSYNGNTYNTASPDAGGTNAYGGYGYIVRNEWQDTRTFMRDYFTNHGMEFAAVDWSYSWSKLQAEVASVHPFVILSLITTAGHYTTAIGYISGQHTVISNDPYGDKNDGYMNYYGAYVYYDWPGYNNGYQNFNTVSCFIYARHAACLLPSAPAISSVADVTPCEQSGVRVNFTPGSPATKHDLYRDGSLAVENYASGAIYTPGDTNSHTYMVKAVNSVPGCFTDSSGAAGTDANVAEPAEVTSLTSPCGWDPVAGASGYRVYRGTLADLPNLLTSGSDGCVRYQDAGAGFDCSGDDPSPEAGRFYWYLVTALTGACEGPAGNATDGPRVVSPGVNCQ